MKNPPLVLLGIGIAAVGVMMLMGQGPAKGATPPPSPPPGPPNPPPGTGTGPMTGRETDAQIEARDLGIKFPALYQSLLTAMNSRDIPALQKLAGTLDAMAVYPNLTAATLGTVKQLQAAAR
jgi:hypothetical protein